MADNVAISEGTGTNIAADDVGGVKYQRVKTAWGVDGSAVDTSATNPLPVVQTGTPALPTGAATEASLATVAALSKAEDAAHSSGDPGVMLLAVRQDTAVALAGSNGDYIPLIVDASGRLHIAALIAGEAHIGEVGGNSVRITPTWTVDTTVYAAGDCVGTKITLANAVRVSGGSGVLTDVHITDRANQKPSGNILIFNADPSAATTTDNAAFVYSTDDYKQIARIAVTTADYTTINSKATAHIRNIGAQVSAASGTSLYAVFVTDGAPDFVNTTDLQISFGILRD